MEFVPKGTAANLVAEVTHYKSPTEIANFYN